MPFLLSEKAMLLRSGPPVPVVKAAVDSLLVANATHADFQPDFIHQLTILNLEPAIFQSAVVTRLPPLMTA